MARPFLRPANPDASARAAMQALRIGPMIASLQINSE